MATFGDITEPTSRATWEDWEDLQNASHSPRLQWQVPLQVPEEVAKFFLFEGKCLWNGVKAKRNLQEVNSIKEANLNLYKSPHTNHFVCVVKDCDMQMYSDVIKLLKDMVARSKLCVAVQEKPVSEFKTNQPLPNIPHIIRKITTTNTQNLMRENIQKLEQPNMISGVTAGVFSLREHLGLSATAIAIYMEIQENQIEDIENLLQKMDMSGAAEVESNVVFNSNLYT